MNAAGGLPLALTIGEPAGVGLDLTLAVWRRRAEFAIPAFYLIGDREYVTRRAHALNLDVPVADATPEQAPSAFADAFPVVALGLPMTAAAGNPDGTSAPAAIAAIRRAVADVSSGRARAIVTNPVAKNVLYRSGFAEPGHTEFLARLAREATGKAAHPVMMLWSPELAAVPVTVHLPLREVVSTLTSDLIVTCGRVAARDLAARFGIARPRIAVAGLNPHAGEDGALGGEDRTVVAPAVAMLRAEGIDAVGPLPADTMFHERARAAYDVALCMYHDQALIPIKTLAFERAVNVTLGLPFVRTSPDHGTAFDIAGKGSGDPSSLIAAVQLADRLAATTPAPASAK